MPPRRRPESLGSRLALEFAGQPARVAEAPLHQNARPPNLSRSDADIDAGLKYGTRFHAIRQDNRPQEAGDRFENRPGIVPG